MGKGNSSSAYQALCNCAAKQSYITFDDILSVAEEMSLSIDVVDWLTDALITNGYLVLDEKPETVESNGESEEYEDFAQIDYDLIFQRIIELNPSLRSFIEEVSKIKPSQRGEMDRLKYLAEEGNTYARERMIEMHIRAALRLALQRAEQYDLDIEETISDALLGLTTAIDKYDPDENDKFSGYSYFWMLQIMGRNHPTKRPLVYYPVHKKDEYIKCYPFLKAEGCSDCSKLANCKHVKDKVADYLNVQYSTAIDDIILQATPFETLQPEMFNLDTMSAFDNEPGYLVEKSPEENLNSNALTTTIFEVLKQLTVRERKVIEYRFGLLDGQSRTLEEVGVLFGVTRERVRQIEAKALRKLKHPTKSAKLKDHLYDVAPTSENKQSDFNPGERKEKKDSFLAKDSNAQNIKEEIKTPTLNELKSHFYSVDDTDDDYDVSDEMPIAEEVVVKKWSTREHQNIEVSISRDEALDKIVVLLRSYPAGLKAKTIAGILRMNKKDVNRILYSNMDRFVVNKDYIWKNKKR